MQLRIIYSILLSLTLISAALGSEFTRNLGQWHSNAQYRTEVPNGVLYVERNAFTWLFHSGSRLDHHGHAHAMHGPLKRHAYQMRFVGASTERIAPKGDMLYHKNFFIGNEPEKWASNVPVHSALEYQNLYPGVDLHLYGHGDGLKYDLLVSPGADPRLLQMEYVGLETLQLKGGDLLLRTSVNEVVEMAPYAFQRFDHGIVEVPCRFRLDGHLVSFELGVYDPTVELVIDPVLTFASYSGSTANNFGFTATYDNDGHLYGGGIVFSPGSYPTTLGALQDLHAGGTIDIGISKFSPDGSTLIYSTLLGGSANESPHSLVVNDANELYILGTTGSANMPTVNAFDDSFGGGPPLVFTTGYGYDHNFGCDILLAKFSADGNTLLGSTFFGGTDNDGLNNSTALSYNYGDAFRGEIVLDGNGNVLIATSTSSTNLQMVNASQPVYGGGEQDALLARFSPDLSNLQFSTYHGGSDADSGFGVQLNSSGEIYMTGGTASPNLPTPGAPLDGSYNGAVDPYVARFSTSGSLNTCTYLGTNNYDQSYFVQLDTDDKVYVVGQTDGAYPVSAGVWSNPNSGQFIHKLDGTLGSEEWSTVIGTGNGTVDISPSAFLVSNCGQIYFSGWGGSTNVFANAINSTTTGLTVTPDAVQGTTDGSDFYLMVLEPDATDLAYATFFGGGTSSEHVDGGTSRFDKDGSVYQAVCAGCGGHDDFPTTNDAWSNTNGSSCNLGVFKFDLSPITAQIDIDGPDYVCLPDPAEFLNLSIGGTNYQWEFGDGEFSSDFEPTHQYQDTGTFTVRFILSDLSACAVNDTMEIEILVLDPEDAKVEPVDSICEGASIQLHASGGHQYEWFPATGLSQTDIKDPIATPPSDGFVYSVVVTDSCSVDTVQVPIHWLQEPFGIDPPPAICAGDTIQLQAFGGGTYAWDNAPAIIDTSSATPTVFPTSTSSFHVQITTPGGCLVQESIQLDVDTALPAPVVLNDTICLGGSTQLFASGGDYYEWLPSDGILDLNVPNPVVEPTMSTAYIVNVANACGVVQDTAWVEVVDVIAEAWPDTIVCPGDSVQIFASGGSNYTWAPATLSDPSIANPIAWPVDPTSYSVTVESNGCSDVAEVFVDHYPPPAVDAGLNTTLVWGESVQLDGSGSGEFLWWPDSLLDNPSLEDPLATPTTTTIFYVQLTDSNGCKAFDQMVVNVIGTLYVPNTFSPNNDGVNDRFFAFGLEIKEFKMLVFNRWGEMIFESNHLTHGWDGTFKGTDSPIGTYVWKIELTENSGEVKEAIGHVNLIR